MKPSIIRIAAFLLILFLSSFGLSACGSSDSSSSASLQIVSPSNDASFTAGSRIPYRLETRNFELEVPFNLRSSFRDGADMHSTMETEHSHDSSMMYDPSSDATSPYANLGHYHVYLDDASGTDPHLTAWTYEGEFQLPDELSPGTHSLRFELRDSYHTPLSVAGSEAVLFFKVE